MKKLASVLASLALAVGLMVPATALAADAEGTIAIDFNGQRVSLSPQVDEAAHSLSLSFDVETVDAKYQPYVSAGFTLSNEARGIRIAQSSVSGSTVNAVLSNGESPLPFSNNVLYLGQLTVNVNAKLASGDSTGAKILVTTMDTTNETFGAPVMHAMDTLDDSGTLLGTDARAASITLPASAYTGSATPDASTPAPSGPGAGGNGGGGANLGDNTPAYKDPTTITVNRGDLSEGAFVPSDEDGALKAIGADIVQKILAGAGADVKGLTDDEINDIKRVIDLAGGNLDEIDIDVSPFAKTMSEEATKEATSLLDKKFSGATLLSIYDLGVTLTVSYKDAEPAVANLTEITDPINFTVGVPEGSLATMNAAVGYVHDGEANTIDKGIVPSLQSNTVQFPASQFSPYAVYGKAKSATPNSGPLGSLIQTSDDSKPILMCLFAAVVIAATIAVVFTGRRRKAKQS